MIQCAHLIDGEWIAEGERFESFASHDGSPVGSAPIADARLIRKSTARLNEKSGFTPIYSRPRRRTAASIASSTDHVISPTD